MCMCMFINRCVCVCLYVRACAFACVYVCAFVCDIYIISEISPTRQPFEIKTSSLVFYVCKIRWSNGRPLTGGL